MKQIALISILFFACQSLVAQSGPVSKWVTDYCTTKGGDQTAYKGLQEYGNSKEIAAAVWAYVNDSTKTDFEYTVYLIKGLAKKHTEKDTRSSYVRSLTAIALKQQKSVTLLALNTLKGFAKSEFDTKVKDDLLIIVAERSNGRSEAIELIGFIGSENDRDFLKGLGKYTTLSKKEKYHVLLALVRLNDPLAVEQFVVDLKNRKINDELVNSLLPDLVYTHNKQVYDILIKELFTDTPSCYSANNDSEEKILCAYRILEQLSGEIISFPVQTDKTGELTGDYTEALVRARNWVLEVNSEYIIDNTNY
ncbi:MAG: hypothetical protein V4604_08750 [Bacteroidota bacterium]